MLRTSKQTGSALQLQHPLSTSTVERVHRRLPRKTKCSHPLLLYGCNTAAGSSRTTPLAGNSNSNPVAAASTTRVPSTSGRSNGSHSTPVIVLVIGNPEAPELQALKQKMPAGAVLLAIGGLNLVKIK
jgi:hypothetical protein